MKTNKRLPGEEDATTKFLEGILEKCCPSGPYLMLEEAEAVLHVTTTHHKGESLRKLGEDSYAFVHDGKEGEPRSMAEIAFENEGCECNTEEEDRILNLICNGKVILSLL